MNATQTANARIVMESGAVFQAGMRLVQPGSTPAMRLTRDNPNQMITEDGLPDLEDNQTAHILWDQLRRAGRKYSRIFEVKHRYLRGSLHMTVYISTLAFNEFEYHGTDEGVALAAAWAWHTQQRKETK